MRLLSVTMILGFGFVTGGATCARRDTTFNFPPPPPVLAQGPPLSDVAAAVNRTSSIQQLSSNATSVEVLSMPRVPKLSATLAWQRNQDFRLRAKLPVVIEPVLDLGSNREVFWFEVPEGLTRKLYYARHDQYRRQLDRAVLPVDPTWISDSLGLAQLDPGSVVAGPVVRPDGKLEVRNTVTMPAGVFQRVLYIDPTAGHVTDLFLYAPSGALIARSSASNHEYFAEHQCSLPHTVQLQLTPSQGPPLEMVIDVGYYAINQILSGDPNLFVMPQNANATDLTQIPVGATNVVAPVVYQSDEIGPMPYRGLVE